MESNFNSECVNVNEKHTKGVKKVDTSNWKKAISAKIFASVTRCYTSKCFKMFSAKQQNIIFTDFWSIGGKQKQDTLLVSNIEKEVTRSANDPKSSVKVDGKSHKTCKNFLLQNLQVSESQMKTVLGEVNLGNVSPQENMGKHDNRPSKIGNHIWEMVREHWDMFPSKNSHYGRTKSERKYFDDPTLNVMKMYKSFQFFCEQSRYSFRLPRTDVCDFCQESKHILNNYPCDSRKVDYKIHKRKIMKYNSLKKQTKSYITVL
ncbi:hypothetical protein PR048_006410 [Dryococelus australis]|uniref:Uncharacterized protein n=1 Tax=Dryococelus australis TaxID=614101 RepID=A0ABQ9IAW4_9NEOP|nr:hypothetical protein PR048_006410 [Dryococelus australis]